MTAFQHIVYDAGGRVGLLTLNRPQRRNALTGPMIDEILEAVRACESDPSLRALVITGAGNGFCAGQDLQDFSGELSRGDIYRHINAHYKPLITGIRALSKPVLAAVNGTAAGAGVALALACDLQIMAEDASFIQSFVNIGLIPDSGAPWFFIRQIGYSRAFELFAEGDRLPARRAYELGLVNRVVPAGAVLEQTLTWAQQLAEKAPLAMALTKKALIFSAASSLEASLEFEAHLQEAAAQSEDFREGVRAFLEKRAPEFKGR